MKTSPRDPCECLLLSVPAEPVVLLEALTKVGAQGTAVVRDPGRWMSCFHLR